MMNIKSGGVSVLLLSLLVGIVVCANAIQVISPTTTCSRAVHRLSLRQPSHNIRSSSKPLLSLSRPRHSSQARIPFRHSNLREIPSRDSPRPYPLFQSDTAQKEVRTRQNFNIKDIFSAILEGASAALQQGWWCFPMFLALVPVYAEVFLGTSASMPSFWPCVRLDHIHLLPYAKLLLGVFLLSNLCYFATGLYFIKIFPQRTTAMATSKSTIRGLGTWILVAGAVSTAFHSVQALGPHTIAESLCYIDHGVAISAGGYFWYKCGAPSRSALGWGAAGLVTLAISGSSIYPWLHSVWHLLSSVAAVVWAHDGMAANKLSTSRIS